MTFIRGKLTSLVWLGMVPLMSLSLVACSSTTSSQSTDSGSSNSQMAQMDHGSMGHGQASPMPMDHGSMSMDLGPADENFDLLFIDGMIPHHEGAVIMAQEALQKSNRPEIKQLAQAIIDAQEQEISELKGWRSAWYPNVGDEPMMYHAEMGHMMPMTEEMRSSMMMSGDLGAADGEFDLRFINAMIPHHQGAIDMAQQALEKSDRPEIKELAQTIISSQQAEIDQMTQWRKDWYGQ
ncbi:DUF305 domain-containing protein [Oscillatoria sp. FACHB-1407]|uniref:DUF305 domain-containing protein n=1 Tax=Oscillatoria sp. FACHB-1407 TaxID=2692847 RepID=UPI001688EE74|nr:DUF305 domain-containing protein [Oscillatoria sp. FACHB-1407]MBD2465671.1 DUF305 domain-containing protein [Oscillatoria sp. FACHB-1407]